MKNNQQGNALLTTVMVMAIAAIWFALTLVVSTNHFQISHDDIARVQADWLARGAMQEAVMVTAQAAAAQTLDDLDNPIVLREMEQTAQTGTMKAQWRFTGDHTLVIEAWGQTKESRQALSAEFVLLELPTEAKRQRPLLLLKDESQLSEALAQSAGYDHLLQSSVGGLCLQNAEALAGNLYCLGEAGEDWTVTIKELTLPEGLLYIDGQAYLNGSLTAQRLVVNGDLYVEKDSALTCPQVVVYGELLGDVPPEWAVVQPEEALDCTTTLVLGRMQQ